VYAKGGRRAIVQWTIDHVGPGGNPVQLAVLHGELGNIDCALEYLDQAIERRDPSLVHLAVAPQWDSLRVDPRFAERLLRMGFVVNSPITDNR
jgi:hypothetical protein